MTGALALVAGAVLLAAGSLRLSAQMAPRSTASFLLGAYVIAWAQLVGGALGAVALRLGHPLGAPREGSPSCAPRS